jgi:hypothetical protein
MDSTGSPAVRTGPGVISVGLASGIATVVFVVLVRRGRACGVEPGF